MIFGRAKRPAIWGPTRSTVALLALGAVITTATGCGSGTAALLHPGSSHGSSSSSLRMSRVAPGVPTASLKVIQGWSDALRSGHVDAAAAYFHHPSVFFLGAGPPLQIRTRAQAEVVNAALPCGAEFISARPAGRYVNVLFRLTNRPGRGGADGCRSGTGATARTNFLIRDGQIVAWLRAPDEPGDNGTPRNGPPQTTPPPPQTTPTSPGITPGGGTPIV